MVPVIVFFFAGLLVGAAAQATPAQGRNEVALNHVGIAVPNVNEAVAYYTQKMGFRDAFRGPTGRATGRLGLVHLQISRNPFPEIQSVTPQRPAGISHIPREVILGYSETLYPDYRSKLKR